MKDGTKKSHVTKRYFVYGYRHRFNVSCAACCWLCQGSYRSRTEAEPHLERLAPAAGDRTKITFEDDVVP